MRVTLAAFLDAVVVVDPLQYQRRPDEREDIPMPLRTLHFGRQDEGLVTILVIRPMTWCSSSGSSGSAINRRDKRPDDGLILRQA